MVSTSQPASARACSGPRMLAAITCVTETEDGGGRDK